MPLALGVVETLDDVGGVAVRHHPPGILPRAVFVVGDLSQSGYRVHHSSVPRRLELPGDESGQQHPEAADLADDERDHAHPQCPVGVGELVVGVLLQTVSDVAEDRDTKKNTSTIAAVRFTHAGQALS